MNFRILQKPSNAAVTLLAIAMVLVAVDCQAATFWDRANATTSGLSAIKPLLLIVGLVLGIFAFLAGAWEIYKLKQERGDAKWSNVGYMFGAGAILTGLSVWGGILQETVTGQTTGNLSMLFVDTLSRLG